jgi:WhiB family redox-sensing transcriptional regulator
VPRRKQKILGEWRDKAACLGRPEGIDWYPERSHAEAARAKAVCKTCPVREDCLEEAIANGEAFGIWGGLDTQERKREARRRRDRQRRQRKSA